MRYARVSVMDTSCSHVGEAHGDVLQNVCGLAPDSVLERTDGRVDEMSMECRMGHEVVRWKKKGSDDVSTWHLSLN